MKRDLQNLPPYTSTLLWNSLDNGTARRTTDEHGNVVYKPHVLPKPGSGTRKLTEAEDNAKGRAIRRRINRMARQAGKPHAAR